jgi:hypothetical protein
MEWQFACTTAIKNDLFNIYSTVEGSDTTMLNRNQTLVQ